MSNVLTSIMPKILARALLVLRGKLVMPRLANSDYAADAAKKGQVINVQIPASQTASDVTPSNTKPALSSHTPLTVPIPLDQWKMTDFNLTDNEMQQIDMNDAYLPMQTYSAIDAIATVINSYLFQQALQIPNWSGTAGTTPFATDASAAITGRKKLVQQKAPDEGKRNLVLDPNAEANALALAVFANFEQTGDQAVKIEGALGRKYGLNFYVDQQVPVHTLGATGTVTVDTGGGTAGNTTLPVTATSLGQPTAGDHFTIAGDTTQYVVVSATTVASNKSTLTISPALATSPVSTTAITFLASFTANLLFHPRALAFAMRPLAESTQDLAFGSKILAMQDPLTGITLRLEVTRVHKAVVWEFDALYGGNVVDGQSGVIVLG